MRSIRPRGVWVERGGGDGGGGRGWGGGGGSGWGGGVREGGVVGGGWRGVDQRKILGRPLHNTCFYESNNYSSIYTNKLWVNN